MILCLPLPLEIMAENFFISDFINKLNSLPLSDKSKKSFAETKADNTIDAYQADWNDFCDWCQYNKKQAFPAAPETLVNYINDLADYAKVSTIRRRISAISENYNAANALGLTKDNPCHTWIVKESLLGISRLKGSYEKGKMPIFWEEIEEMVRRVDLTTITGLRDRALLLLGFMGAFRRSELVGLDVEDIRKLPQGILITIKSSKTDKLSSGQQIAIPYLKSILDDPSMDCIAALDAWKEAGHLSSGPLFRRISKAGNVLQYRLSDKSVSLIVKKYAAAIGLDPTDYGGHSLRHGFATYAAEHRLPERLIMKQTRHKSVEMVRRYINDADMFTDNPLLKMFGK